MRFQIQLMMPLAHLSNLQEIRFAQLKHHLLALEKKY
jgi:hypothetical protein